jgi:ketosteroid isomerase-like protein
MNDSTREVQNALAAINRAWRSGRVSDMVPYLHPDVVMTMPGFTGSIAGRDKLIAGFEEFCANARVVEYTESDQIIEVIGNSAVVSFKFDMLYERPKYRERSQGRDLWLFQRDSGKWVAVWRTMIELSESREEKRE